MSIIRDLMTNIYHTIQTIVDQTRLISIMTIQKEDNDEIIMKGPLIIKYLGQLIDNLSLDVLKLVHVNNPSSHEYIRIFLEINGV